MIALLEQAVALGVLRPLDVQFARVVASEDEPDILLAAACLSAEAGAGHVCLMLEQLQADTLFEGRQPALALAVWEAAGRPDSARWQQRLAASAAVGDGSGATPLVLRGPRLYLQRMWQNEGEVAAFIG
ncbi:exodeoxyribonuclease V subunit alpha, partial [Serratia marcescens]